MSNPKDTKPDYFLLLLKLIENPNVPFNYQQIGDHTMYQGELLPLGNELSQYTFDQSGLKVTHGRVAPPVGCGHLISNIESIAGFCAICHKLICTNPGCLEVCSETGALVCRKCRVETMDGRIVSKPAAKKMKSKMKSLIGVFKKEKADE